MSVIRHRVGIKGAVGDIFRAISEAEGLAAWWSGKATGSGALESEIELDFLGRYPNQLWKVVEWITHLRFRLRMMSSNPPWQGSELLFELKEAPEQVFVTLTHFTAEDISEDAFLFFSTKWPTFLLSLKDLIETGVGKPFPNDIRIQHDIPY